jgi:hypothetical protein
MLLHKLLGKAVRRTFAKQLWGQRVRDAFCWHTMFVSRQTMATQHLVMV